MTEENNKKQNINAYHRERYAKNIEKERERQKEKYHRTKKLYCDLTEEEVAIRKEKNKIRYHNWKLRQSEILKVAKKEASEKKKKPIVKKEISKIIKQLNTEVMVPKKIKLPERIKHKYVCEVLRKFNKSKLCNILISTWTLAELKEFELLEEEFNKK